MVTFLWSVFDVLVLGILICVFSFLLSLVVNIMHGETACICKFILDLDGLGLFLAASVPFNG